MPRKSNVLTVQAWPKLANGKLYRGKVKDVRVDRSRVSHYLRVVIENLDCDQQGRMHELDLPLPVHPGSRAALFLVACGIDATRVGSTICLDSVINAVLAIRFRGLDANAAEEFDFEPITNRPEVKSVGIAGPGSKNTAVPLEDDHTSL